MERMCARPESRIAWFNSSEMPPRAGDERDGDLAGLTLQCRPDAGVDACSQRIDARPGPEAPRQSARVIQGLNLARRVTRRSEACKPGLPSKIESARLYRFRRGLKRSAERHCLPDAAIWRHRAPAS